MSAPALLPAARMRSAKRLGHNSSFMILLRFLEASEEGGAALPAADC